VHYDVYRSAVLTVITWRGNFMYDNLRYPELCQKSVIWSLKQINQAIQQSCQEANNLNMPAKENIDLKAYFYMG